MNSVVVHESRPDDRPQAGRRRRVVLWIDEVNTDFLDALQSEGIEVAAVVQASHAGVPSFSVHDLYFGSGEVQALPRVTAPAGWIDDESFRTYARCIQRIGFYPGTDYFETVSSGVALTSDLEDWARVHLNHALQILDGVSADEVWFSFTPHLGVDNMLALAAIRSGRTCLVFTQIKFATKFSWKQLGVTQPAAPLPLQWKPWRGGAVQPNLFYMRENDTRPWYQDVGARIRFMARRLGRADWASVASRLYQAARKRRAWRWMHLLELQDRRTRPWAALRLQVRRGFERRLAGRISLPSAEGLGDFVYLALHLEPEENVHALGGRFRNQLDAVVALRELLPEGWTLILKENPKQTFAHRGQPFDMRLAGLDRVRWVDPAVASKDLIARARLVASITGTAGYEALLAGTPCIYFGEAWYAGLPGSFAFSAELDLLAASRCPVSLNELDAAVDALLGGLADGLAHPRFAGIHRENNDIPALYREAARSMASISAAL